MGKPKNFERSYTRVGSQLSFLTTRWITNFLAMPLLSFTLHLYNNNYNPYDFMLSSDWGYRSDDYNGGTCVVDSSFSGTNRKDKACTSGLVTLYLFVYKILIL